MGLFDDLFGMGAPAAPGAPPAPGLGDRMMNPMTQMGLALLSNHGTLKSQRGMFDGVGEAGIRAQVYGDARREKAEAKAEKNKTLEFLRQQHPDIASLVDSGMDVGQAFSYALQRQNIAADNARADRAFGLQQAALGREQAGWNATAKYLESQGADPALIELARSGEGSAAFSMFNGSRAKSDAPTGYRWNADRTGLEAIPGGPAEKEGRVGGDFKTEQDLRKEYIASPEIKEYGDVRSSYERMRASASIESGPGDIGIIFGYMKMLDPGSVVREGEFATASNSAGVPTAIVNTYNRLLNGERLTPEQRKGFLEAAGALYGAVEKKAQHSNERFRGIAETYGIEPSRIIQPLPVYESAPAAGAPVEINGYTIEQVD